MGKRNDRYDPCTAEARGKVPLVQPPFRVSYFCKEACKLNYKVNSELAIKKLQDYIQENKRSPITANYTMLMLKTGVLLQDALKELETTRHLKIVELMPIINFIDHPLLTKNVFPESPYIYSKPNSKQITNESFLTWNTVLRDLIFQLSEHVRHFLLFVESHRIPTFSQLAPKSSTPE